jgi:RNA-binding protein
MRLADSQMLSDKQILFLRKHCHHLKPVVTVGNAGLTENVINELDLALAHHELIKVKINSGDRDERKVIIDSIAEKTAASLVQSIGHTASFYRTADKPVIVLPKR